MLQDDRAQAHLAHSDLHSSFWWHDRTAECEPDLHGVRQDHSIQGDNRMTELRKILLKLIEIETHIIKGFDIVIRLIEEMKEIEDGD
jgi:hypothetical protein